MADLQYRSAYQAPGVGAQVGHGISNAILAARAYKDRMAQIAVADQWHRAQYAMEQEKLRQQAPLVGAQTEHFAAGAALDRAKGVEAARQNALLPALSRMAGQVELSRTAPGAFQQLYRDPDTMAGIATDLRGAGVMGPGPATIRSQDLPAMIAAASRAGIMGQIATSPSALEQYARPVQTTERPQVDPFTGVPRVPAEGGVITPYQTGQLNIQQQLRDEQIRADTAREEELMRFHKLHAIATGLASPYVKPEMMDEIVRSIYNRQSSRPGVMPAPRGAAPTGGGVGALKLPDIGDIEDGHRYKGGDPSNPMSWEREE